MSEAAVLTIYADPPAARLRLKGTTLSFNGLFLKVDHIGYPDALGRCEIRLSAGQI